MRIFKPLFKFKNSTILLLALYFKKNAPNFLSKMTNLKKKFKWLENK